MAKKKTSKQIINVIEIAGGSILSIDSFIVDNIKLQQDIIDQADKLFQQKALENDCEESEVKDRTEDGCYSCGDYEVLLTWTDNVH